MQIKTGFIGVGNMGGALARAAAKSPETELLLSDFNKEKVEKLAEEIHAAATDNDTVALTADYIFLGVKPQMMEDMIGSISKILQGRTTPFVLVTMAAGLSIEKIRTMAGGSVPIIRIMPNTPCSVGEGLILYDAAPEVTDEQLQNFLSIMKEAGRLDRLPQAYLDAASAVSGCGPAFVCLFIEALADGAVAEGLPRNKALQYAAQTVAGSARMVLETGCHPAVLKDAVCSPGGSTITGVRALENGGFRAAAINAVIAAAEKTKDLG